MFDFDKETRQKNDAPSPRGDDIFSSGSLVAALQAQFSHCADLMCRRVFPGGREDVSAWVCWLDGLVNTTAVSEDVLRPLALSQALAEAHSDEQRLSLVMGGVVYCCSAQRRHEADKLAADLTQGRTAVVLGRQAITFETRSPVHRAVSEPTLEKSALGARDSFTETFRINTALVRQRLHTPALKLWECSLGKLSATRVGLFYLEGTAEEALVQETMAKLEAIDVQGVTALGDVAEYLAPARRGAFPQLMYTERPDRFATQLLEGRVGLLMDGLPQGLLLPSSLPELLRVAEDRSLHAAPASAVLLLRWLGLLLSLLLPGIYVAVAMYHQEMIPYQLLQSIIAAKQRVPFSTSAEILGMLIAFGLLQEAGLRLPDAAGTTVSIIGTLIVGQSAVEARVVSPIAVIVVALSGIAGYTQPNQHLGAAVRLWRFVLVIFALFLGMYGLMAGVMVLLWRLCSIENAGRCYLYPLADGQEHRLARTLLQLPRRLRQSTRRERRG